MNLRSGQCCPCCGDVLDRVERHDSRTSRCRHCGRLCLEGQDVAQTILHLPLRQGDAERAFSDLGAILRRGKRLGGSR